MMEPRNRSGFLLVISGILSERDDRAHEEWTYQEIHLYRYHRNRQKRMESMATEEQSLEIQIATFLADLAHANHSLQAGRAYLSEGCSVEDSHRGAASPEIPHPKTCFPGVYPVREKWSKPDGTCLCQSGCAGGAET